MKGFIDEAVRPVTRARFAAYEIRECYLMWKSLWPFTFSPGYTKRNAELVCVKAQLEKCSGDCDRNYMFLIKVDQLLCDKLAESTDCD